MKKGLLIVSFGTSYPDAYASDIAPVEKALAAAFPDRVALCAMGSRMILKKLRSQGVETIYSVEEALEAMASQGVTDLLVQPTFLICGIEYERMLEKIEAVRGKFQRVRIGAPLLASDADLRRVATGLQAVFSLREGNLLLMGHGTDHEANRIYARLEEIFHQQGHRNVFIGTVEGTPTLSDCMEKLSAKAVTVAPLLLVAGDHAKNDMAGDKDSWKTALAGKGFAVNCSARGLGSYKFVQELFVFHALNAE